MNVDHDLEREIVSVLTETAPVRAPEYLLPSVISRARQKRRWPRWYALAKEPTMHSDSRLTVGSPTAGSVRDSVISTLWIQEGADATVTGSTIKNEVLVDPGAVAELRDNLIDGVENEQPYGVRTNGGTTTLSGNTIRGQVTGLDIGLGTNPTVEGNTFEDNTTAINVSAAASAVPEVLANITGNTFCGNVTNVSAAGEVDVDLACNEVSDADLATAP